MKRMLAPAASAALASSVFLPVPAQAAKTVKKDIEVPVGVAASTDGSRVWVASAVQGAIYRIARGNVRRPIQTRSGNANFIDLWTTPTGRVAYALDEDAGRLRTLRWGSRKFATTKVRPQPVALTGGVSHGRKVLYVLSVGTGANPRGSVTVINRRSGKIIDTWRLPRGNQVQTQSMALSPDGAKLYLGNLAGEDAAVYVMRTRTGKLVRRLRTMYPGRGSETMLEVGSLAVDTSGRYVFVGAAPGSAQAPFAGTYKLNATSGHIAAKRLVTLNFMTGIAVAGSRVVALAGNSLDPAPSRLQVLKRKNLRPAQPTRTVPQALALATSTKGNWSRAHLALPDADEYWAIPFRTKTGTAAGNG